MRQSLGEEMSMESNQRKNRKYVLNITQGALIAVLYVVLTVVFALISFGAMQVRISEVLTVLPMFVSSAVPGLFVGCILANIIGGEKIWDTAFGSIATLIGAFGGYLLRKNRWLVPIPSIVSNTIIVPFILRYAYEVQIAIPLLMLYVMIGEIISCYILGELLISILQKRSSVFKK